MQYKIIILFLWFIISIANVNAGNEIHITDAWISEAPPTVRVVAGYMTIKNTSTNNIELLNVESILFNRIELHLSYIENGIAKMRKQGTLTIPAKSEISLTPGSYHLMLFDSDQPLKTGDQVPIELTLSNGDNLHFNAEVKRTDMHQQHNHH